MLAAERIKLLAARTGFDLCGVASCRRFAESEARFRAWLGRGCHASLGYLERNVDKRFDPRRLVEGARTAVVCAVGYKNRAGEGYPAGHRAKVASYACTTDYHTTLRAMLHRLFDLLAAECPGLTGRAFVDTAPLSEKRLAVEAGLGWIGRQSLLVTPRFGTYVLLGELILTAEADRYDAPFEGSRCGSCRRCLDSCPSGALAEPYAVDARRCISRHTVERETDGPIDLDGWIFGCDACQSCCPYNRRAPVHAHPAFDPLFDPVAMGPAEWLAMDEAAFDARLGGTPLARSGLQRLQRNLRSAEEALAGDGAAASNLRPEKVPPVCGAAAAANLRSAEELPAEDAASADE